MDSYNTKKEKKVMVGRTWVLPRGCAGTMFIRDTDARYGVRQNQS